MDKYALLFAGPQGSGKGTQAKQLSASLGAPLIGMGDIFRRQTHKLSLLAFIVNICVHRGILVPDIIVRMLISGRIYKYKTSQIIIFDGIPRTVSQKKLLDNLFQIYNIQHVKIIVIDIPKSVSLHRLSLRKRLDDTTITIKKRLEEYREETVPMISSYTREGRSLIIDGTPAIAKVTQSIHNKLANDSEFGHILS